MTAHRLGANMANLRLQELHPTLVHAPITLLPLAIGADLLGRVTNNKALLSFGQITICAAAAGAVASAVTGLIAGEEVNVEGKSRDMLQTHRNLNFVATVVACCMAVWRSRLKRPGPAYLCTGAAGIGVVSYTGYLGGKLVYDVGVGVEPAHGVYRPDAPKLEPGRFGAFLREAGTDLWHGLKHMVEEVRKGEIVPSIVAGLQNGRGASRPFTSNPPAQTGPA